MLEIGTNVKEGEIVEGSTVVDVDVLAKEIDAKRNGKTVVINAKLSSLKKHECHLLSNSECIET